MPAERNVKINFDSNELIAIRHEPRNFFGKRGLKELTVVVFVIRLVGLGSVAFAEVVLVVPYRRVRRVRVASLARRAVAGVIVARLREVQHGAVAVGRGSRRSIPHLVQLIAGFVTPFVP